MAMESVPPSQTLHLPRLRRRWQVLFLQIIATAALMLLLFRMTEVYGPCDEGFLEEGNEWCPSYEHTRGLMAWIRQDSPVKWFHWRCVSSLLVHGSSTRHATIISALGLDEV